MSKLKKILPLFFLLFVLFLIFNLDKEKERSEKNIYFQSLFTLSQSWQESPEFLFVDKNSLRSFLPPYLISKEVLGTIIEESKGRREIMEYLVEEGDTISSLSQKFEISIETILWANNLNKNSILKPGQKIIILPVSGILHHVKSGDTLSEIAQKYQAKIDEIISFNELESPNDIYVGDILIVPNGKMPAKTEKFTSQLAPLASGYFICPVVGGCRITQGLHWYNAIDFSNGKCNELILAAAGGVVQKAKYGWNGGAGNVVSILHPNGVVTIYGHLQTIFVVPGQTINQGEIIGSMGRTGRSSGCHLHFAVYGAKNPFAY